MNAPKILIPTDLSEHADHAMRYAASLGERFGATLHLLHVVTLGEYERAMESDDLPDMQLLLEAADTAARSKLDAGVLHGGEAEVTVVRSLERGVNAWEPILRYAERESIDLIVMAMRGGTSLTRFFLGSVAERVIRFASCPVLIVEAGDRDFVIRSTMAVRLEKVVIADDLTEKTGPTLKFAVDWLAPYEPEIHMLHAVETEVPSPYVMAGCSSIFSFDTRLQERIEGILIDNAESVIPARWRVHPVVREGKAHKVVPEYAHEIQADLLVVAGESRIDLTERILGGTIERIARRAPCAMLIA